MDPKLRAQLIRDEGYRLLSYQDSLGYWTVGIGHYLGTQRRILSITPIECEAFLESDVQAATALAVGFTVPAWPLMNFARQRALINMAFNLGPRLAQFALFLGAVQLGNWSIAAEQMLKSKWAAQVGVRATHLRDVILTGID